MSLEGTSLLNSSAGLPSADYPGTVTVAFLELGTSWFELKGLVLFCGLLTGFLLLPGLIGVFLVLVIGCLRYEAFGVTAEIS